MGPESGTGTRVLWWRRYIWQQQTNVGSCLPKLQGHWTQLWHPASRISIAMNPIQLIFPAVLGLLLAAIAVAVLLELSPGDLTPGLLWGERGTGACVGR